MRAALPRIKKGLDMFGGDGLAGTLTRFMLPGEDSFQPMILNQGQLPALEL